MKIVILNLKVYPSQQHSFLFLDALSCYCCCYRLSSVYSVHILISVYWGTRECYFHWSAFSMSCSFFISLALLPPQRTLTDGIA